MGDFTTGRIGGVGYLNGGNYLAQQSQLMSYPVTSPGVQPTQPTQAPNALAQPMSQPATSATAMSFPVTPQAALPMPTTTQPVNAMATMATMAHPVAATQPQAQPQSQGSAAPKAPNFFATPAFGQVGASSTQQQLPVDPRTGKTLFAL